MTFTEICHTHLTSLLIMNKFYVTVPDTAALTAQIAQLQQAIVAADAREDRVAAGTVAREQSRRTHSTSTFHKCNRSFSFSCLKCSLGGVDLPPLPTTTFKRKLDNVFKANEYNSSKYQ